MGPDTGAADRWPADIDEVVERFLVCDVTTIAASGRPVTWPLTPYMGPTRTTIDVSTGVTYPAKAERARSNPHTSMLFWDPQGSGMSEPPLVLVQGLAAVRDADIQANTDRYIGESLAKMPGAWRHQPAFLMRAQAWYWARVYIEVTPTKIMWWPDRRMSGEPEVWTAPAGTTTPVSDPAPGGPAPGGWQRDPAPWSQRAAEAARWPHAPVLSVVGDDGLPFAGPTMAARLSDSGFELELPEWLAKRATGPACLGFSRVHGEDFRGQENAVFTGTVSQDGFFSVDRLLPDFSLPSRGLAKYRSFLGARARLAGRLEAQCRRRGQAIPVINIPAARRA